MKIGIQTWGSDGDIRPFIALAGGLTKAGHEVTLVVSSVDNKDYRRFSESLGFRLISAGQSYFVRQDEIIRKAVSIFTLSNPLRQFELLMDILFEPAADEMYEAARRLCKGNDLIIGHFLLHPAHAAAEQANLPYVTVTLNHGSIPTSFLPPTGFPSPGRWMNPFLWKLSIKIMNRYVLPYINGFRSGISLGPVKSFRDVWESRLLNLIAVSPAFCEGRDDWESHNNVCGFFNMPEEAETREMPEDLRKFLSAGPEPIYITMGSMIPPKAPSDILSERMRLFVDGALLAECRAIVQSHWHLAKGVPEHPHIYRAGFVPHSHIFPKCAAVVHHGGAGTTQAVSRAGRPSIIVAHVLDQFFWGSELKRLGIAPAPIEHLHLTPKKLADAIRKALDSPAMQEKARAIGRKMNEEDGVKRAVESISQLF